MDRVFLRPQYTLHYRRARRVRWTNSARSDYAVLFLLQGRMRGLVAGEGVELREAGALFIDPGIAAEAATSGGGAGVETELLTLTFAPSLVLDSAVRMGLTLSGARVMFSAAMVDTDEHLTRLARDLSDELAEEEAGQGLAVAALVEQMLVHLLRRHANVRRSDELELSRVGLVDRRIRRAVELMHAHMDRDLPLEELAAAAYLSPFHFARLFKKLAGTSPHAYLAALRVERAQSLLAETDISISEVSRRVGYSSPSHFTKAFRQTTGLTPRAFRAAIVRG